MRVIIAGSRQITSYDLVRRVMNMSLFHITTIVSGGSRGVDKIGEKIGYDLEIHVKIYLADWDKYGKKAGYLRNVEMAHNADALIAVWDGKSPGTKMMIDTSRRLGLLVYIHTIGIENAPR